MKKTEIFICIVTIIFMLVVLAIISHQQKRIVSLEYNLNTLEYEFNKLLFPEKPLQFICVDTDSVWFSTWAIPDTLPTTLPDSVLIMHKWER